MSYRTQTIRIEGLATDTRVALALSYLADFPNGSFIGRCNDVDCAVDNMRCFEYVMVLHKEAIDRAGGNITEALNRFKADIFVSQLYRFSREDKSDWQPTNNYIIGFDESRVNLTLLERVQEQVKLDILRGTPILEPQ